MIITSCKTVVRALAGAAMFDMEYARWLDDDGKRLAALRGLWAPAGENRREAACGGSGKGSEGVRERWDREVAARERWISAPGGAGGSERERSKERVEA